jgi:hypothetical protein
MTNLQRNIAKMKTGVVARYGNFFRGDSDFFTHCLILKNGECWLLGQGLQQVYVRSFKAPAAKFRSLTAALASIPAGWAGSSYGGYNFITDAEGPNAMEVAVYGQPPGVSLAGYFVPPAGSTVEALVKAIANID